MDLNPSSSHQRSTVFVKRPAGQRGAERRVRKVENMEVSCHCPLLIRLAIMREESGKPAGSKEGHRNAKGAQRIDPSVQVQGREVIQEAVAEQRIPKSEEF